MGGRKEGLKIEKGGCNRVTRHVAWSSLLFGMSNRHLTAKWKVDGVNRVRKNPWLEQYRAHKDNFATVNYKRGKKSSQHNYEKGTHFCIVTWEL